MTSEYVKVLTGAADSPQLAAIYAATTRQLLGRLHAVKAVTVPDRLAHIVDEVTIARFNYIGSEGMTAESVEGHSATYAGLTLDSFARDIAAYIADESPDEAPAKQGVVRFI